MKIKNRPDYLSNVNMIVNIKDLDSSLLEKNKLSFKGVFSLNIYYTKYIPTKIPNCVSIGRMIMMKIFFICFLMMQIDTFKKNNQIKYLIFTPTEKNKETLRNYKKLRELTKRQIKVINDDEPTEYRKNFMKIKFESDHGFPFGKTFNNSDIIIIAASVLEKNGKYYPRNFLHECTYKL